MIDSDGIAGQNPKNENDEKILNYAIKEELQKLDKEAYAEIYAKEDKLLAECPELGERLIQKIVYDKKIPRQRPCMAVIQHAYIK